MANMNGAWPAWGERASGSTPTGLSTSTKGAPGVRRARRSTCPRGRWTSSRSRCERRLARRCFSPTLARILGSCTWSRSAGTPTSSPPSTMGSGCICSSCTKARPTDSAGRTATRARFAIRRRRLDQRGAGTDTMPTGAGRTPARNTASTRFGRSRTSRSGSSTAASRPRWPPSSRPRPRPWSRRSTFGVWRHSKSTPGRRGTRSLGRPSGSSSMEPFSSRERGRT
mmetsp:Transcript_50519/g.120208  ORF Transcript_50519/g.120208 Transcript_50519/m.120208 type:complete len:226 (-) Transcript_50519:328-1005(-)